MELNDKELLRLLKHGRAEELAELAEEMKPTYADTFPAFMDQMLKEHHLKRSTVARRSGLSQDYLYKLLRGDKRTTERDYIIAICMAAGLNIAQTQHALRIYGMPLLDRKDLRSNIIYVNIDEGANIDALNDRLEKVHLPILRTSPEMEKAVIAPNAAMEAEKEPEVDKPIFVGEVEEIGSQVHAEHCGNAPFDFAYWAEIHLEDEQNHQFRVQAYYDPISSGFTAMTEEQFQANEALRKEVKPGEAEPFEKYQMLEWYETLAEAAVSPFFSWYLELDERTDKKVLETLRQVDDTRFCPDGCRIGGKWAQGPMIYMESFNCLEPGRREYFQIQQQKSGIFFSATHESIYMRMELGDIYPSIFGKSNDIEYWIHVKSLDDIPEDQQRIRHIFDHMLVLLHAGDSPIDALQTDEDTQLTEQLNALKDQAINSSKTGDWETGLKILDAQQEVMRKLIGKGHDLAASLVFSEVNRAYALENLKRQEEAVKSWRRAYEMKTEFSENGDTGKPLGIAAYHVAEAEKDRKQASALYMEAASLLEPHCDFRPAAIMYFLSCLHYAYSIDEVESEKAVGIYRKALSTMRRYHLDENQNLRIAIATTCNNLAWVLWNRLNSEEAAVYYGMALDMLEEWLTDPEMESEPVKGQISHIGTALYHFYIDTNKLKEAERIKARLEDADAPMREVDND